MLQRVYGKLKALENPEISDPFISSTVYRPEVFVTKEFLNAGAKDQKQDFKTKNPGIKKALGDTEVNSQYATLGKVIANFIGYPLAATCLYDEVQMIFYPLNHQCGGARIHTTASFPVPISRLREEVQNAAKTSSNISVKRMFSLIEKVVKDRNLDVYNISEVYNDKDEFAKKTENQQLLTMIGNLNSEGSKFGYAPEVFIFDDNFVPAKAITSDDLNNVKKGNKMLASKAYNVDYLISLILAENSSMGYSNEKSLEKGDFSTAGRFTGKPRKRLKEMLSDYRGWLGTQAKEALTVKLSEIYGADGLATVFPGYDRFVRPNISLDFEVVDAIDASNNTDASGFKERFLKQIILPKDTNSGLLENKTILRLHIYDEESVMAPSEHTLMSTVTEGTTGTIIVSQQLPIA